MRMRWRHVMVNTHCTWLPGSAKGFRNRRHRIHSSGDYKHPPPAGEHKGLREYNQLRAAKPLEIPPKLREKIGRAFVKRLRDEGYTVLAVSVSAEHVHALVLLPDHRATVRRIIGRCKQYGTRAGAPDDPWANLGRRGRVQARPRTLARAQRVRIHSDEAGSVGV